ncbi:hypothetical protein, partial [Brunnivagina elsteri]|uniref:hypothetical protein n=1 Tax=Brunnivagina elsteri TaxID=1247191 RepID=UPI001B805647
ILLSFTKNWHQKQTIPKKSKLLNSRWDKPLPLSSAYRKPKDDSRLRNIQILKPDFETRF